MDLSGFICMRCGVQQPPSESASGGPANCAICDDERECVNWQGQQWTTLQEMTAAGFRNSLRDEEPGLTSIGTRPSFGIGQRALLVQTAAGNVLWDCISCLDDETVAAVRRLGGVQTIAISHPHFYGSMIEWSQAFDNAPIYLPIQDREWVMRPDPAVRFFEEEALELLPGLTLLRVGGHFDGAALLHWRSGFGGNGVILSSDTITVAMDRRSVSFMYSYPNLIPLSASVVRHIVDTLRPYPFERIYGGWDGQAVVTDGRNALDRSAHRYIEKLDGA